jgi:hypothetical protein
MESIFLTQMREVFGFYMGTPVNILLNRLFFGIGTPFWARGVENTVLNFKSEASVEQAFSDIFAGNACEFYDQNKRPDQTGVDKMVCADIYQGVNTQSLGFGLYAHYDRMDAIRSKMEYYNSDPNPEYQGEVPCYIPPEFPLVGWMMKRCMVREPIFKEFSKFKHQCPESNLFSRDARYTRRAGPAHRRWSVEIHEGAKGVVQVCHDIWFRTLLLVLPFCVYCGAVNIELRRKKSKPTYFP